MGRRPGGRCQSFLPNGWRGDAKPPVGDAGGDDHRSRGERAAVRAPQPVGARVGAPHGLQCPLSVRSGVTDPSKSPCAGRLLWRQAGVIPGQRSKQAFVNALRSSGLHLDAGLRLIAAGMRQVSLAGISRLLPPFTLALQVILTL